MRRSLILLAALGLAACASQPTPFQPADDRGMNGYTVTQIEAERYRLSFNGNTDTTRQAVDSNLIYLAAQLTLKSGGDWFELTRSDAQKSISYPTYPEPFYGDFGWWSPHYAGATSTDFSHPENSWDLTAEIIVHHGQKPVGKIHAYDARDVLTHVAGMISRTGARPGPY